MSSHTEHIKEDNLSIAWAKAFLATMGHPEISPMTITVTGLSNESIPECCEIRNTLERSLKDHSFWSCHTVANTIFPKSLWNRSKEQTLLYKRYLRSLKQIRKCKGNCNGMYFERLIAYGENKINQLEYIIETYTKKGNHRRSALQASLYDPTCDATDQRQRGFPCLQQVGFSRIGKSGLCVTGYYPKEHILDRGYGNYLGLCRLGQFMASEMGLELAQMTCFVGVACVGNLAKTPLRNLEKNIKAHIEEYKRVRGKND
ncbi:thymidylate synthase [bacterium]|nr:thymidylate synthase [bacterium]